MSDCDAFFASELDEVTADANAKKISPLRATFFISPASREREERNKLARFTAAAPSRFSSRKRCGLSPGQMQHKFLTIF
jgi:hypothetical protein